MKIEHLPHGDNGIVPFRNNSQMCYSLDHTLQTQIVPKVVDIKEAVYIVFRVLYQLQ